MNRTIKIPFDSFARRASAYIISKAILGQGENNFTIEAKKVWRAIENAWPDHLLPVITDGMAEKICSEIMENWPVCIAEYCEYEDEEPYFDLVMYTEYTIQGTCGEEDY